MGNLRYRLLLSLRWENQLKTEIVGRRKDRERREEGREGEKERFSDDVNFSRMYSTLIQYALRNKIVLFI